MHASTTNIFDIDFLTHSYPRSSSFSICWPENHQRCSYSQRLPKIDDASEGWNCNGVSSSERLDWCFYDEDGEDSRYPAWLFYLTIGSGFLPFLWEKLIHKLVETRLKMIWNNMLKNKYHTRTDVCRLLEGICWTTSAITADATQRTICVCPNEGTKRIATKLWGRWMNRLKVTCFTNANRSYFIP